MRPGPRWPGPGRTGPPHVVPAPAGSGGESGRAGPGLAESGGAESGGAEHEGAQQAAGDAGSGGTGSGGTPPEGTGSQGGERDSAEAGARRAGSVEAGPVEAGPWAAYPAGPSFLAALRAGRAPRAVWSALPGHDWTAAVARAAAVVLDGGRGVLIVVPDGRDVARVDRALTEELGLRRHVALTAELGPAERYRRWLAVRRGRVACRRRHACGDLRARTRPRPGRPVGRRRRRARRAARALPARARGARPARAPGRGRRAHRRLHPYDRRHAARRGRLGARARPRPRAAARRHGLHPALRRRRRPGARRGRTQRAPPASGLPHRARRGSNTARCWSRCRAAGTSRRWPAHAAAAPRAVDACEGPLSLRSSHAAPYCRWCGRIAGAWTCPECGGRQVRAVVIGSRRTAEELGRAFPGVPMRTSGRDAVLAEVSGEPALVVATPGAEPVAEGGYAAALLLDGWVLLGRADLRAGEEALRRWMNAAALVRPRGPVDRARRRLADDRAGSDPLGRGHLRRARAGRARASSGSRPPCGWPPSPARRSRYASWSRPPACPRTPRCSGRSRWTTARSARSYASSRDRGATLSRLLKAAQAARSTRKTTDVVRVRVDPLELI